jgi:hypothetical protein
MTKKQSGSVKVGSGKGHNSLFRSGPNWKLNACVGRNGGQAGFARYARGYFEAGARLVRSLQDDPVGVDIVIYPLVMNYRHGIEAALKHLAKVLPILCDESPESKATHKPNHRLMDDWKLVRRLLARVEVEERELKEIESTLIELVEIDPNGTSFRFPKALDGTVSLQDITLINVEVFGQRMAHLAEFLENGCGWVDHLYAEKCEYEQYMAGDLGW